MGRGYAARGARAPNVPRAHTVVCLLQAAAAASAAAAAAAVDDGGACWLLRGSGVTQLDGKFRQRLFTAAGSGM